MKTYTAIVERGERWWVVRVPGLGNNPDEGLPTQVHDLAEVEPMARDLIATWLDVAPDSFEVHIMSKEFRDLMDEEVAAAEAAALDEDDGQPLPPHVEVSRPNRQA
ncbi:hypothetical protein A5784_12485 [Mycobacterium sp. 852013-50091_SCH5140682]|nr:hypothetical protein A5784_12485 [Mycobacterium sp. 852013-50091_SCH5140682]